MHYGDPAIRRAVPLALGLLSTSNPQLHIMDTLSKYSHDSDLEVAINAILAMGLIGAGSNNARLGQMLRQLASYYYKEPGCLFTVRISQGLLHLGKGLLGLSPLHTDRFLMSSVGVCGLLATLVSFTDSKKCESHPQSRRPSSSSDDVPRSGSTVVLDKSHWMLCAPCASSIPMD